jgi:hypothetical protein
VNIDKMTTISYTFTFNAVYDESIFMQSPFASDTLRPKVQAAVVNEQKFLTRFPNVNAVSQQVTDAGLTFKVLLYRT